MKTVIFDMDGLLIDSEPMWQFAEKQVFTSLGVNVKESLASQTATMTTREVTEFWFAQSPWQDLSLEQVENDVIDLVASQIRHYGVAMHGVEKILGLFHSHGCKIGLATNAPRRLIPVVLEKLGIEMYFDAVVSSTEVERGKPYPDVYLAALRKLNSSASETVAFEDSTSGLQAASSAGIKTVVIPPVEQFELSDYQEANLKLRSLAEFGKEHLHQLSLIRA